MTDFDACTVKRRRTLLAGLAMVLIVSINPAEHVFADGVDSLCIHFEGTGGNVILNMGDDFTLSGKLPATICNLHPGAEHRFVNEGYGLEKRIGTFRLDGFGAPSVGGIRTGAALRNAVIVGWGSFNAGRVAVGITDLVTVIPAGADLIDEQVEYESLKDEYDIKMKQLENAGTWGDLTRLTWEAHVAAERVNVQNSYRKRLLAFTAYLYGFQVIDPWLSILPPRMKVEAGGSVISIRSVQKSRAKAFLHSFVRPGRGQFYQGKTTRGVLFSVFSAAAGLWALDYQNRYDKDVSRYNLVVELFNNATLLEDKKLFQEEADELWKAVEDAKRKRNASYIVLASIWGLSLLDTFFPGEDDYLPDSSYSFEWSPSGGALVIRF